MRLSKAFLYLIFVCSGLAGCADNTPAPNLPAITVAFTDNGGLYYLDTQRSILKKLMNSGYYQARLSPDKSKIACLHENNIYVTIFDLDSNAEIVGKPKTVYNSQALSSTGSQGKSFYPTWSADGNKFFFVNNNHLVVYDYQEKHTTSLFDFPESQSGGLDPQSGNMALSRDGSSLYLMLSQAPNKVAFWRVDASGSSESQLAVADLSAVKDAHFPAELPDECIETLFGSKENPVWAPAFSNDGRYYFYVESGTGFMAKEMLKGYDRTQKTKFDVVNLGTNLYK